MATLYEIDSAIYDCVDEETGEIIDFEMLNTLLMERNKKLEGVAIWIKNLESDAAAMKAEREALARREKAALKKAERLKLWLTASLEGVKFSTPRVSVNFRSSRSVEVNEAVVDHKWCREKTTYIPDKQAIKSAIESGKTVEGCTIIEKLNIQIK